MRVLILSQYFYPELISTGQILTELAEDLIARGCSVSAIAGQPTYYDRRGVEKEIVHRGIRIFRVGNTQWDKNRIAGKIANSITFFGGALRRAFSLSRGSIILAVTNPPFLPLGAYLISLLGRGKYICLIHDVYPDIAVRLGYLRAGGVLERLWNRINLAVWGRAEAIIVLGRDMEETIRTKLPPSERSKIVFIPNWSDGESIVPLFKEDNPFLPEAGLDSSNFFVQYSGNMGLFHDMETIVRGAALLKDIPARFLFIGGGGKRKETEALARSLGLDNVLFFPYQPKEKLRFSLSCSDVSLVCLEKGVEGLAVPCKYYGILASGRPVIALMDERAEIARSIRETECGYVIPQGDADRLAEAIRFLFLNPEVRAEMGRRARDTFDKKYSREIISRRYFDLFRSIQA
jgi:glycosyltransferase involved in cell wall biosynthesis